MNKKKQSIELAMQNFNQNSLDAFIDDNFCLFIRLYDYNGNDWIIEVSDDEIQYRAEKQLEHILHFELLNN